VAKLSTLVVDLQLQSAQLRAGLDEANRKLDSFAKQAEKTGNVIAGAFAWDELKDGLITVRDWLKAGADTADQMGELAESVGVPVEALSKLSFAAQFSGSSTEAVGKALAKTADMMRKAAEPTSEQAAMFKALGIGVTDAEGRLRGADAVFADISQRFAETADGSAKTALAVRLFGDEGAKMVPLLNNGKAGLAAWGAEAERTGNVITEKGAASAGQFNDALDRLQRASEGLAASVAQKLAPSVAAFAEELTTSTGSTEAFETVATVLANTMRVLATAAVGVATSFEIVGKAAAGAVSWTAALFDDDATGARSAEAASAAGKALLDSLKDEGRKFRAIWDTSGPGATMAVDAEKAKPSADEYVRAVDRTKKAAEAAAEAQKKLAADTKKAMEDAAKAMDDYVKSALALDRKHADIARATAKRREDAAGALPTDGFADMEDALARMEAAQKAAATMQDRANVREKAGDLIGADSAIRKAADLEALADRASTAVDAFRDLGKAAEEAATRALEAQVEAAAELERRFDDIDREVASRRDAVANPNRDATAGFASFSAALDAMAEALKREAELRADASALEQAGKLGEARQALLAAEATKALAETASVAADALAEMDAAAAAVPSELGGMLTSGLGPATSATLQGVETGAAAGPAGAVVGGLVGLLSQSEQFQGALDDLEKIFQDLANSVGMLVEPLLPLLTVVAEVAAGLGALLGALSPIVEFVARPLFEVLKGFGMVVLGLVKFVGEIINGFVELFGGEGFDLGGIDVAMARLEKASYDSAKAQQKVTETSREMAGALNVPSWWKDDLTRNLSLSPGRDGGGTTVNDNSRTTIQVNGVTDPDKVADKVDARLSSRKTRGGDAKYGEEWVP
jgi:hypothetical protein